MFSRDPLSLLFLLVILAVGIFVIHRLRRFARKRVIMRMIRNGHLEGFQLSPDGRTLIPPPGFIAERGAGGEGVTLEELDRCAPAKVLGEPGPKGGDGGADKGGEHRHKWADCDGDGCDEVCAICLDEMHTGMRLRELPCGHAYHGACIERWISHKNKCPKCNRPVVQRGGGGAAEGADAEASPAAPASPPPPPQEGAAAAPPPQTVLSFTELWHSRHQAVHISRRLRRRADGADHPQQQQQQQQEAQTGPPPQPPPPDQAASLQDAAQGPMHVVDLDAIQPGQTAASAPPAQQQPGAVVYDMTGGRYPPTVQV